VSAHQPAEILSRSNRTVLHLIVAHIPPIKYYRTVKNSMHMASEQQKYTVRDNYVFICLLGGIYNTYDKNQVIEQGSP
jgi:hypothetical protein